MGKLLKIILFSTFLFAGAICAFADVSIKAYVDKDVAYLDEDILLNVVVEGVSSDAGLPKMPSLANFNIYSTGQSRSVSIINGNMQSSVRYTYILSPRFSGKTTIDPIILEYNGKKYSTEKIDLVVIKRTKDKEKFANKGAYEITQEDIAGAEVARDIGNGKYPDEPVFMYAEVDKKSAYVNEQITLSVRFYSALETIFGAIYFPPDVKGLFAEELPSEQRGVEVINGKKYGYVEYKTALFGASSGRNKVSSASVEYEYKTGSVLDEFFPGFFTGSSKRASVKTTPIAININQLPTQNKPTSFNGAVGNYSIKTSVDDSEIRAGEVFDLITKISGTGYIRSLSIPNFPELENFKIYDSIEEELKLETKNDILKGYKTFRTAIVPKNSGSFVLPKIEFSYFDTKTKQYKKVYSKPLKIEVLEARQGRGGKLSFTEISPETIKKLGSNINYIKEDVETLPGEFGGLMKLHNIGGGKFSIFVILIISFVIGLLFREGSQMFSEERLCSKVLAELGRAKDHDDIHKAFKHILNKCLKIKTTRKVKDIAQQLKKQGFSQKVVDSFKDVWIELENIKYAPSKDAYDVKNIKTKAVDFVDLVSQELRTKQKRLGQ